MLSVCWRKNRLVLAHVLGGAEAATDFRQEKELKAATFLMETVTGADCEASPPEGTPVTVQLTTEFTNGTKVGAHQRHQKWHAHSTHDIEELVRTAQSAAIFIGIIYRPRIGLSLTEWSACDARTTPLLWDSSSTRCVILT